MNQQQTARTVTNLSNEPTKSQPRSGVHAKGRKDASGGWGLVLLDLMASPKQVTLTDGAIIGASARDAKVEGAGVAAEHAKVAVRSDGCYLEDLGSQEGTFVGGVRAQRINVSQGDVVRLGKQLAIFVERELNVYGPIAKSGSIVHGPKSRRDWIDPVLELAKSSACVCIEGGPGAGKTSLAKLAAAVRESAGDILTVDARGDEKPTIPAGARPTTWVVLHVDKLPRPLQLEIAHALGRQQGVSIIATSSQPLDRAAGDGLVAPWFASLFSGKRVQIPALELRREDVLGIVKELAQKHHIPLERFTPEYLEALLRAGWPGGVPQLEKTIKESAEKTPKGPLQSADIAFARPVRAKPSLPPSTDPSLARARLEDALARANGSVASAARSLGMSRQAIYREADRLGLDIARRKLR